MWFLFPYFPQLDGALCLFQTFNLVKINDAIVLCLDLLRPFEHVG